jgi:hypothetical protein
MMLEMNSTFETRERNEILLGTIKKMHFPS